VTDGYEPTTRRKSNNKTAFGGRGRGQCVARCAIKLATAKALQLFLQKSVNGLRRLLLAAVPAAKLTWLQRCTAFACIQCASYIRQKTVLQNNTMTERQQWKMFRFYVQTVFLLEPHKLEVSFATLQRLCRWCTVPAYPIRPKGILVAHGRPWFWSSTPPVLVVCCCPWSCSPLGSILDCLVATSLVGWNLVS